MELLKRPQLNTLKQRVSFCILTSSISGKREFFTGLDLHYHDWFQYAGSSAHNAGREFLNKTLTNLLVAEQTTLNGPLDYNEA